MVDYRTGMDRSSTNLTPPRRVLAVGAHPDDAEFGAGATLAKWAAGGAHITVLVLTDGSKGSWDPSASPSELAQTRAEEQRRAADALGVVDTFNLGHVDGELEYSMELRADVCAWIRRLRPDVLLSHDPWRRSGRRRPRPTTPGPLRRCRRLWQPTSSPSLCPPQQRTKCRRRSAERPTARGNARGPPVITAAASTVAVLLQRDLRASNRARTFT